MNKWLIALLVASGLVFSGCGGGGGSDSSSETPVVATVTGQFIDAPVEGLSYSCSSGKSGITDFNGTFVCNQDDTNITFSIGNLVLGSASARNVITPLHLYSDAADREKAYNVAQLLHSLDDDANPDNNIKLDTIGLSLGSIDISADSSTFENALASALASNGKTLYNRDQAQAKMYSYISNNAAADFYGLEIDMPNKLQSLETLMCTISEKLSNGECKAKTCQDDAYGCPTCTINEDLVYGDSGSGSCVEKSCDAGLFLVNGECVENQPPVAVASASNASIIENESVTLDASSSSDADGTIVSYEWKLGFTVLSNEMSFTTTTLPIGLNLINLTITDNTGNIASTDISISVSSNPAPVAKAGAEQTVYYLDSVTFDGSASTDNGEIVSYEWKKGDVLLSNSSTFTKDDFSVGTHNITLSVTDDGGKTSTDDIVVTIFDTFTNILPMKDGGGSKMISSSTINGTTTTTLGAGSSSYFNITNNTNRNFTITSFEIISTYNGVNTTRVTASSSQISSILGDNKLLPNQSPALGYTLSSSQTANYWTGRYYLTDDATGETFTNEFVWNGTSFN